MSSTQTAPNALVGEWPSFPELENGSAAIPALHAPGAWPIVRDRWERVVTTIEIPQPADAAWAALVDPEALRRWLAVCSGSLEEVERDCVLDFEDGEFFLCRPKRAGATPIGGYELHYLWRWLGIGQATAVTWRIDPTEAGSRVTVTEEAYNPPADWRTWHGGGWPGILDQLAAYLRTGTDWRWPWRRMGPYVQIELPAAPFEAWEQLVNPGAVKYWLQRAYGKLERGGRLTLVMGDASGMIDLVVRDVVDSGQSFPSYLPHVDFALTRAAWGCEVGGRLWIEPTALGRSLFQVFHYNWESLPSDLQLSERKIVTGFWTGAMLRAAQLFAPRPALDGGDPAGGHE